MKKILVTLTLLTAALLGLPGGSATAVPAAAACATTESMFCTGGSAVGPFTNYVDGDRFCRDSFGATRCEVYWPFVNPTINPELAPASAFGSYGPTPAQERDRLAVENRTLSEQLVAATHRIDALEQRIKMLKKRIRF